MNLIFMLIAALFVIFVVVIVHESGHFWVARWCGVKVLKFSIGFGRPLWSRTTRRGTEIAVGWLPLGGYVKLLGEGGHDYSPEQAVYAYENKPVWQRMLIVLAGPTVNFILAVFVLWATFMLGVTYVRPVVGHVVANSYAARAGIKPGDEFVTVGNMPTPGWRRVLIAFVFNVGDKDRLPVQVRTAGHAALRTLYFDLKDWRLEDRKPALFQALGFAPKVPEIPAIIAQVAPDTPAFKAGLQPHDKILAIDGKPVANWLAVLKQVEARPKQRMRLLIARAGKRQTISLTTAQRVVKGKTEGFLGVMPQLPSWPPEMLHKERYSFWAAGWPAVKQVYFLASFNLRILGKMILGKVSFDTMGGPVSIVQMAGKASEAGVLVYLSFIGFISVTLGLINLLPIPGLDGGHFFMQLIEVVIRRPIPDLIQEYAVRIGILLLIFVMIQATLNDVLRLL